MAWDEQQVCYFMQFLCEFTSIRFLPVEDTVGFDQMLLGDCFLIGDFILPKNAIQFCLVAELMH
jgi:hypothetical protein